MRYRHAEADTQQMELIYQRHGARTAIRGNAGKCGLRTASHSTLQRGVNSHASAAAEESSRRSDDDAQPARHNNVLNTAPAGTYCHDFSNARQISAPIDGMIAVSTVIDARSTVRGTQFHASRHDAMQWHA